MGAEARWRDRVTEKRMPAVRKAAGKRAPQGRVSSRKVLV